MEVDVDEDVEGDAEVLHDYHGVKEEKEVMIKR